MKFKSSDFKIQNDIPIPNDHSNGITEVFRSLKVKQSVLCPNGYKSSNVFPLICRIAKVNKMKFTTRRDTFGRMTVWRVR